MQNTDANTAATKSRRATRLSLSGVIFNRHFLHGFRPELNMSRFSAGSKQD
jgi:hypothetical protein